MSTFSVNFTADVAKIVIGNQHYGPPSELASPTIQTHHPLVFAVAQEFLDNGTTSGTIVVTAS